MSLSANGTSIFAQISRAMLVSTTTTDPYTIAGWIYAASTSGTKWAFSQASSAVYNHCIRIGFNSTSLIWQQTGSGGTINHQASSQAQAGKWIHVAAVSVNGDLQLFYKNGRVVSTINPAGFGTFFWVSPLTRIGASNTSSGTTTGAFQGLFCDVGFWDRALSPEEIRSLADGNRHFPNFEIGLIDFFPLRMSRFSPQKPTLGLFNKLSLSLQGSPTNPFGLSNFDPPQITNSEDRAFLEELPKEALPLTSTNYAMVLSEGLVGSDVGSPVVSVAYPLAEGNIFADTILFTSSGLLQEIDGLSQADTLSLPIQGLLVSTEQVADSDSSSLTTSALLEEVETTIKADTISLGILYALTSSEGVTQSDTPIGGLGVLVSLNEELISSDALTTSHNAAVALQEQRVMSDQSLLTGLFLSQFAETKIFSELTSLGIDYYLVTSDSFLSSDSLFASTSNTLSLVEVQTWQEANIISSFCALTVDEKVNSSDLPLLGILYDLPVQESHTFSDLFSVTYLVLRFLVEGDSLFITEHLGSVLYVSLAEGDSPFITFLEGPSKLVKQQEGDSEFTK